MHSFTQAEVSRICNVSRATVNRWVELSIDGKNNLQLDTSTNKVRILDNPHNEAELKRLSATASKYQGGEVKKVTLSDEFYELFSDEELSEFYTDLKYNSKVNPKYSYKNIGAKYWDDLYRSGSLTVSKSVDQMLAFSIEEILYHLPALKKINLIDLGPGDGYPVKKLINRLLNEDLISKYIAVDISREINEITSSNLKVWFPSLKISEYQRDIEHSNIGNIFLDNKATEENNIILILGNAIANFDDRIQIFKHLRSGMIPEDFLIVSFTLDVLENKVGLSSVKNPDSDRLQSWLLNLLKIDVKSCKIILDYNEKLNRKTKGFQLDKDYEIEFRLANRTEIISLKAGQIINTWRHYLVDIVEFIEEIRTAKLEIINLKTDLTGANALAICRIKN